MTSNLFTEVLRQWAEVFMHRSMRDFHQFTRESGLSMSQLNALFRIYHGGACGVSDIGEHLGVTSAASSQMIERLVQLDLLQRSEDPLDRRNKSLNLTDKGRALIGESIEARRRWMQELTNALTAEQQDAISGALTVLTEAARRLEEE
jgi:DNA-binding MarR family transcriptional regulator